jgi:tetratricopeptide (TPR) repeat protein
VKRRATRGAGLLTLLLCLPGAVTARSGAPAMAGESSRRQQAYYYYSLAQQSLLERDYLHALEQMERAAASDASAALLLELAHLRFSLNDLDGAADLAQRILTADQGGSETRKLLGDIHLTRARQGIEPDLNVGRALEEYQRALEADPTDAEVCQSLAELYYHTGRLEEAGGLLRSFSQKTPLDQDMSLLLGKIYVRTKRFREAEEILTGIAARSPGNLEAADALAALFEYQKKYDEAIAIYMRLVRHGLDTAYIRDRMGSLYLAAGRYDEAIRELEEAHRLEPENARGLVALAKAYEGAGDMEAALARYDRAIRQEPGNLEARFHRARMLQSVGETADALKGFREIIDLAGERGPAGERENTILALAHSQIGLLEMESRNFGAAATAFTDALNVSEDPGPELFQLLARAILQEGKLDEARVVLREAARRHPDDLDLKILDGELLIAGGDDRGALQLYRTLLSEQKGSAEAYVRVSEGLLRQKRYDAAEAMLKDGTRRYPSDDALCFARGAVLERMGRLGEAERMLLKAIELNSKNAMALNYLGYMLADRGLKLRESVSYVERALVLDPRNAAYLDSLGWAQFKMSRYELAEKNLRLAAKYDQGDPTIREHLGDLLMATGRGEEAVREWETSLARGHDDPDRVRKKISKARVSSKAPK